ncbi:MAG: hypothetical protein QM817_05545 [Archangium sp.]
MLLALILAATPVSLQIELSRPTKDRVGQKLEDAVKQRLAEEGFELSSPAKIILRIEELHGTIKLTTAAIGADPHEGEVSLDGDAWREEVLFEIAQRLAAMAHTAEAELKPATPSTPAEPREETPAEEAPPPPPAAPADTTSSFRVGAGFRAGVAFRFPAVDPTFAMHGVIAGNFLEPMVLVGLTLSPGPGLFATEVPIAAGLRVPIHVGDRFTITPEALLGARVHLFGPSALDPAGGARVDLLGGLGVSALVSFGGLRVGLRLGLLLSVEREHVSGADTLWSRGPASFTVQAIIER